MKPLSKVFLVISFLLLTTTCLLPTANAAIPHLINYQGRLTDSSGVPLNGSYQLTFRIYDAETAGNLLWQETHTGVVISKGIFSLMLGSVIDLNLPFDQQYYLEIKVADEVMSPRQRIASSAYAFRAEEADNAANADTVGNVSVSTTPAPNKLLPLNSDSKMPLSTVGLKVYDSGWFAVSLSSSYTKTHNLATNKLIIQVYFSQSSDGSNAILVDAWARSDEFYDARGCSVDNITATSFQINTADASVAWRYNGSGSMIEYPSGFYRVIALGLE